MRVKEREGGKEEREKGRTQEAVQAPGHRPRKGREEEDEEPDQGGHVRSKPQLIWPRENSRREDFLGRGREGRREERREGRREGRREEGKEDGSVKPPMEEQLYVTS